jgi:hypothetical protein
MNDKHDMFFPDQNSTNFPMSLKNNLAGLKYDKNEYLQYHQFIVHTYVINNEKSRGVLLFQEMGWGKSILAMSLAEYYRKHDPDRKIVVLLAKSLQKNMKKNIKKYINNTMADEKLSDDEIDKIIETKYKFVSLNASNMFTQMTRLDKTQEELEFEKKLKEFADITQKGDFLENSLLIIDEFHNLSNAITNGSTNAIKLYDSIMKTKNIKLLFLTGTPFVNNPFEIVPTFNMLKGLITIGRDNSRNDITTTLFPETKKDFDLHFVDSKHKIKNVDRFQNRIIGLCSYYGSIYFGNKVQDGFPTEYPLKLERVMMSTEQFARYDAARDLEKEEALRKGTRQTAERFSTKGSASSSYRIKTRQISNFMIPEHALGPVRGQKSRKKFIDKITNGDLNKLQVYSPKMNRVWENIRNHKSQLGVVYSEFVTGEGLAIFSRILEENGYNSWSMIKKGKADSDVFGLDSGDLSGGASLRKMYAVISGDVDADTRDKIVEDFNHEKNVDGSRIHILLISKTGAEGLDLKRVRHIHIMEPFWNYARIGQVIARASRYLSHESLPKKEQNVQPYIYLSDYPKDYKKKKVEYTTDIDLFNSSLNNKKLIEQFCVALAEASIDCTSHHPNMDKKTRDMIRCKMCTPNNKPLYHPILSKDMQLPNPCTKIVEQKIKAHEIHIDDIDEKFYYTKGDTSNSYIIYKFDKQIGGYITMNSDDSLHSSILRKILKL